MLKSNLTRTERRAVSNAIHGYHKEHGTDFGAEGFCHVIGTLQEIMRGRDEQYTPLYKGLAALYKDIWVGVLNDCHWSYLPHALLGTASTGWAQRVRVRRTWLRHWTEVGVALDKAGWDELQGWRKQARAATKASKVAALAIESEGGPCDI